MKSPRRNRRSWIFAVAIATTGWLSAQTAPTSTASGSSSSAGKAGEAAVELSPFTVTADKDLGYLAGNTLAGSRINTQLKDTAASISVFTEEFMKDLGAINLDEVMDYANNSVLGVDDDGSFGDAPSGNPTYQSFGSHRVRGMQATRARNYFEWSLPVNTYNVGRIDDSRGPNSVLFGIGSAGGTINASTRQPVLGRSFQSGTLMTDNFGSLRGTLDFNRSLYCAPQYGARLLPNNTYGPPPEGEGRDIGLSVDLIDGKLFAKAVYYESAQLRTTGFGFGSTNTSPTGLNRRMLNALAAAGYISDAEAEARNTVDSNQNTLDRTSDGYEFSLVANPTKNWRLQMNYSITNFTQDNTAPEIFAWAAEVFPFYEQFPLAQINTSEGITAARDLERFRENMDLQKSFDGLGGVGNRRYKVNVFTRYSVSSGRLKGLYFGGGYRHQGKILVGRYTGADGALLWGNSFWQADALLGYQFRRLKWLSSSTCSSTS